MERCFALRGHIAHTPRMGAFEIHPNACLVCEDGKVAGVFGDLPERYAGCMVYDFTDRLIIPGLCDAHVHAPQYAFRGLGMDLELIDWLNARAFPEECRYRDAAYAALAYGQFADALRRSATTRACVFATVHTEATLTLMRLMEQSGVRAYVGKVCMERNAPDALTDPKGKAGLEITEAWVRRAQSEFTYTKPIVTPRFAPSLTEETLKGLGALSRKYGLPVQTHLSENPGEIAWVGELFPQAACYLDVYRRAGLAGSRSVMAHCVHPTDAELAMMQETDVLVAHCPGSNMNIASGIAPIRRYLDAGVRVALGSDVAGGHELSLFRAMTDAVQVSKLRARWTDMKEKPLSLAEAFYMATKGGGELFGKVGSFETGYAFDAVALDDGALCSPAPLSVEERLERAAYFAPEVRVLCKFADGQPISL